MRDGPEKTKAFSVGRGLPAHHRYKRSAARRIPHRALRRKALGFFRYVTRQASGSHIGEALPHFQQVTKASGPCETLMKPPQEPRFLENPL
jgi:hypothetical protein